MAHLEAEFEPFRIKVGRITLFDSSNQVIIMLSALGKSAFNTALENGNPGANPLFPFGDTPKGEYQITAILPSGPGTAHPDTDKFGNKGVIKLDPISGDALTAKNNGRDFILIHGGKSGTSNLLRRTNGCIRMMNSEIESLINNINDLNRFNNDPTTLLKVIEVDLGGSVFSDIDDDVNEGDPPQ